MIYVYKLLLDGYYIPWTKSKLQVSGRSTNPSGLTMLVDNMKHVIRYPNMARALVHQCRSVVQNSNTAGYPKWYVSTVGGFKPLEQDGASGFFITITISRLYFSPPL